MAAHAWFHPSLACTRHCESKGPAVDRAHPLLATCGSGRRAYRPEVWSVSESALLAGDRWYDQVVDSEPISGLAFACQEVSPVRSDRPRISPPAGKTEPGGAHLLADERGAPGASQERAACHIVTITPYRGSVASVSAGDPKSRERSWRQSQTARALRRPRTRWSLPPRTSAWPLSRPQPTDPDECSGDDGMDGVSESPCLARRGSNAWLRRLGVGANTQS